MPGKQQLFRSIVLSLFVLLFGCSSSDDSSSSPPPKLSGTIAHGAAGVGTLYIKDAAGSVVEVNINVADNGAYSVDISGKTAPFVLAFDEGSDSSMELYSFAEKNSGVTNVTDLTTLTVYMANTTNDLQTLYNTWDSSQLSSIQLYGAQAKINANFKTQLDNIEGIDAANYDFFSTSFSPDGTGIDELLETITLNYDSNNNITVQLNAVNFNIDDTIDISEITLGGAAYDPDCSSGWCLKVTYSVNLNGQVQSFDIGLQAGISEEFVPTITNNDFLQESFSDLVNESNEFGNFSYQIIESTPTRVVVVMNASIVSAGYTVVYSVTQTYTKSSN